MNEEVPMEEEVAGAAAPEAVAEEQVDPMENLMEMLAELQERYGISQEEMDAVVDAINMAFGAPTEEAPMEEPVAEE